MSKKQRWGRLAHVAEQDPGPVVQRIMLGGELRVLRDAAKISTEDAAATLGWYRAKVSKVETGTVRMTAAELSDLLRLYNADDATTERVQRLGEEARRKTSPARVPDWARQYVSLEANATEIKLFFGDFVPGMLQTRDYARALLLASIVVPPADVEQMATNREHRAERLRSGAPLLWAVLGEAVYIEGLTSSDYLVRPQHIQAYNLAFDRLRVASLGDRESLAIINTLIDELEE